MKKIFIIVFISISFYNSFSQQSIKLHDKIKLEQNGIEKAEFQKDIIRLSESNMNINFNQYKKNIGDDKCILKDNINFDLGIEVLGHDRAFKIFRAPGDLSINKIGINFVSSESDTNVSVRLVKIIPGYNFSILDNKSLKMLGYYSAKNDQNLYNICATPFDEEFNSANDHWVPINECDPFIDSLNGNLWPEVGKTLSLEHDISPGYQWIELTDLVNPITIKYGDSIGIIVKNNSDEVFGDRIRIAGVRTEEYSGLKFHYSSNLIGPPEPYNGWFIKDYKWDMALEVAFENGAEPIIEKLDTLQTHNSTEPREINAHVISQNKGVSEITSVLLKYKINRDGQLKSDTMDLVEGDNSSGRYRGFAPALNPGDTLFYYIQAFENFGYSSQIPDDFISYGVFTPKSNYLLIFNGLEHPGKGSYPQSYYFTPEYRHCFDVWAFAEIPSGLLDSYDAVVEIIRNGPKHDNTLEIRKFLSLPNKKYMLAGDNWFQKYDSGSENIYELGSFEYDILGIRRSFADINYSAEGDERLPSEIIPIEESIYSSGLYKLWQDKGGKMLYSPDWVIGIGNYLDGIEFVDNVEIFMHGYGKDDNLYNIGGVNNFKNGNKVMFMAYDPISIFGTDTNYFWYGYEGPAPRLKFIEHCLVSVDDEKEKSYELFASYPNPFNPSTKIVFTIPKRMNAEVKIYDMLGREIWNSGTMDFAAGKHEVEWRGVNNAGLRVSSGAYIAVLKTDNYHKAIKLSLIK